MVDGALRTLKSLLLPSSKGGIVPDAALTNTPFGVDMEVSDNAEGMLTTIESGPSPSVPHKVQMLVFCKLLRQSEPARAHRERIAGELSLSNLFPLTTHAVLRVDQDRKQMFLCTAPMNLISLSPENVPLMLNPFNLSLQELEEVRLWKRSQGQLAFTFRFEYLHTLPPELLEAVPGLLKKFMDRPGGIFLGKLCGEVKALVERLRSDEIIEQVDEALGFGSCMWKLSMKGAELVETCVVVGGGCKLLCKSDQESPLSMTTYEVVLALEADGFKHVVLGSKDAKKKAKTFYMPGDAKEWYTKDNAKTVSHWYLCALCLAADHGKAVPHLAADSVYKDILGLDDKPRRQVKQKKLSIQAENFWSWSLDTS